MGRTAKRKADRKIIQIIPAMSGASQVPKIFALCDDGSVWYRDTKPAAAWVLFSTDDVVFNDANLGGDDAV